jgi:site-specific DNA-methyltransferase (adenine-specific)
MKAPRIIHADCLDALRAMDACSVDAIVTDPPAGIAFMGKAWDKDKGGRTEWVAWMAEIARECLRVIKPGGHALVWALPRTSHWTGWAWEDAGWQPRDKVVHLYGSGFPKSLDVSKAIDKAAGAAREVLESRHAAVGFDTKKEGGGGWSAGVVNVTAPATEAARQWQGWGSALKPAAEDWWLMRKPLDGTIAANVIKHGTGAINVDGCRVGTDTITTHRPIAQSNSKVLGKFGGGPTTHHTGRWPANVTLDAEAAASLGESARFFYVAKPSRSERDAGCDELEPQQRDEGRVAGAPGGDNPRNRGAAERTNSHPTVKSIALMRWLVRLITPPGGVVLDPFCGSGTTLLACIEEGVDAIGIEREAEYVEIIRRRVAHALKTPPKPTKRKPRPVAPVAPQPAPVAPTVTDMASRQLGLFDGV